MEGVAGPTSAIVGRGHAASRHIARTAIVGVEHEIKVLPHGFLREDGSLDLYDDVRKLFRPIFDNGRVAIQCGGWVGYIPLNDRYALEVSPRVPIGHLERLIGRAAGYSPRILDKYTRQFAHTDERPESIFDVLTDQMLDAFDRVWEHGVLKTYERRTRIGTSPVGRVDAFESAWRTTKLGRPAAASSAFHRTVDFAPNRVLRHALEKLLARYVGDHGRGQRARVLRLRRSVGRLSDVGEPKSSEVTAAAVASYIRHLPARYEQYVDALLLAQLIIFDAGLSIRGADGLVILPSILIDMSEVFEGYVRRVLADSFGSDTRIVVKDGNSGGPGGAKLALLDPVEPGIKNVPVTPDIVIEVDGIPRLVIDAKYKPAPSTPNRDDVNQVVTYGARYGVNQVMLLHAGRSQVQSSATLMGKIGTYSIYNGLIDLHAKSIEDEEQLLAESVKALL